MIYPVLHDLYYLAKSKLIWKRYLGQPYANPHLYFGDEIRSVPPFRKFMANNNKIVDCDFLTSTYIVSESDIRANFLNSVEIW